MGCLFLAPGCNAEKLVSEDEPQLTRGRRVSVRRKGKHREFPRLNVHKNKCENSRMHLEKENVALSCSIRQGVLSEGY